MSYDEVITGLGGALFLLIRELTNVFLPHSFRILLRLVFAKKEMSCRSWGSEVN